MSQANEKWQVTPRIQAAADALIQAIQEEAPAGCDYLILPSAMSESFFALLRSGMPVRADKGAWWAGRGAALVVEAIARTSQTSPILVLTAFSEALSAWLSEGLRDPSIVLQPKIKPQRDAS